MSRKTTRSVRRGGEGKPSASRPPKTKAAKNGEQASSRKVTAQPGGARRDERTPRQEAPAAEELRGLIATRAYELYEQRDRQHGYELEDWLKAEQLVLAEKPRVTTRTDPRISVTR